MPRLISRAPETPIEFLAAAAKQYLYMPDPGALYVLMGAVAGSMLEGYPIYLMLVGPPGCGGTVVLDFLLGMPGVVEAGLIESPGAFLSASSKRDRAKDATGGLLNKIGKHGALLLKDFTSILSLDDKTRDKVLAVLREAYDGRWTRPVGTDGGKELHWEGRLAAFAKVTSSIDQYGTVNASLGERWIYYRFPASDGYAQARQVLLNSSRGDWKKELELHTHAMFEALDLKYHARDIKLAPRRELTDLEMMRIIGLSAITTRCRSAVVRDRYKHEVIGVPEQESMGRLSGALQQLYIGMETVGVPEKWRWRLLTKVAMDSMPRIRRMLIEAVKGGEQGYPELRKVIGCSQPVIRRAVEDLELHGVLERHLEKGGLVMEGDDDIKIKVKLSSWMQKEMKTAMKGGL